MACLPKKLKCPKTETAADVVFSFNVLMDKGDPLWSKYWADVEKVEALDDLRVKFFLSNKPNPELALIIGQLTVLPKHYWQGRDFSKPGLEIPIGSGPYKIAAFKPGRSITYKRDDNYWAKDHPVKKGRYNFGTMTYDYYRDSMVSLHAFKAGEFDFRRESSSRAWATAYTGPPFDNGFIIKEEIDNDVNQGMQCFVFNIRRSLFKDRKVREALTHAFDFEWTNKNLFYGFQRAARSARIKDSPSLSGSITPRSIRQGVSTAQNRRLRKYPQLYQNRAASVETGRLGNQGQATGQQKNRCPVQI
jgi:microcin C transport system substrate-binding protein